MSGRWRSSPSVTAYQRWPQPARQSAGAVDHAPVEFPLITSAQRGEWDRQWNGWWGDDPPFHAPVFVLTHHAREPQPMDGGTTFYFVTG